MYVTIAWDSMSKTLHFNKAMIFDVLSALNNIV